MNFYPSSGDRMSRPIPFRYRRAGDRALCCNQPVRQLSLIADAKFPQQVCLINSEAGKMRHGQSEYEHERHAPDETVRKQAFQGRSIAGVNM